MTRIANFELGKTRIMAEARDALRRIGIEYHCVLFDVHGSTPLPAGATLTISAEGSTVTSWFNAEEIEDSCERVARADIRQKVGGLVARIKDAVTA